MKSKKRLFFRTIDLGVKFELTLKIFIVALFSSLLMGSAVYKYFELSLIRKEKAHMTMIRAALAHRPIDSIGSDSDILSLFGLTSFWILDHRFKTIDGFGPSPDESLLKRDKIPLTWIVKRGVIFPNYRGVFTLSRLKGKKGEYILYLHRDLRDLNDELYDIRKVILYIVLSTTILIILLLNFLLHTTITKPINNIINDINMIENNKKKMLEGNYLREFNYLINNFNNLIKLTNLQKEKLKNNLNEVQQLNLLLTRYHDEMSRFEKLISIGELSAGVAHEIGNPLNNIIGYLNLSKEPIDRLNDSELSDYFTRIRNEADRIDHILKGMLEFSRKDESLELISVNLADIIDKTIELSRFMIKGKEIAINPVYPARTITVKIDPNRFQQILLNLISNAIDSIKMEGTIEVGLEEVNELNLVERELMESQKKIEEGVRFARVCIKDNGSGIDKNDLKHVFDPFFTTKEPGKGTGLGLSVSLRLIKEMGGILRLESEKGKGTKAIIILPAQI